MKTSEKMLNEAPGFTCPVCERGRVKLSLADFLGSSEVRCPICGTPFQMDKAGCTELVDRLQDLQVAQQNVRLLEKNGGR
ncbi:MAG: hypothetical protein LBJ65_17930 [Burkholderia sp.]|jgi:transcription elongation factor Elf1|uniref:hypothetical protein n=1 Tax=Burkholderia sp. TaxID=36773 RepID=UPI00282B8EC2|nr:hypothetical protein [Burkholderia sp.]MDR0243477.1 hypothetical protein [Burkholderia sp.]